MRVSVGPPPLVVPMKVTVMLLDMVERVDLWRETVEWMQSGLASECARGENGVQLRREKAVDRGKKARRIAIKYTSSTRTSSQEKAQSQTCIWT